jgi:hypothetical protein
VNAKDKSGWTPLHYAVGEELARMLREYGGR